MLETIRFYCLAVLLYLVCDLHSKVAVMYNKKYLELCKYIEEQGIKIPLKLNKEVINESD